MRVAMARAPFLTVAAIFLLAGASLAQADPTADTSAKNAAAPASPTTTASPSPAASGKTANEEPAADTPAVVVDDNKVESVLGKEVTSAKGEKLGQITDILVSFTGEIRAAVIDFGGFLGVGSRKIAVAWSTLHFSPKAITLSMTRDELRVTPEYHPGEPIVIVGAAAAPTSQDKTPASAKPSEPAASPAPAK